MISEVILRGRALILLLAFAVCANAQTSTVSQEPLSERRVSYSIDASLDPETKTILGRQRLVWRNPDKVPVDELQFHLYLNAFRDRNSTFMKESGGRHRGFSSGSEAERGIDVTAMRRVPLELDEARIGAPRVEEDLTGKIEFIQPDDGNLDDKTVISVPLDDPVAPGASIALEIDFEARLPRVMARTGWAETPQGEPFFMVAQWFPKIGVREVPGQRYIDEDAPSGKWYTHQFHANSEFYADFGTYDVSMTVPDGYVVGATGVRTSETDAGDGFRKLTYEADDVHDFAWTASPAYIEHQDEWRHVKLRLLLQPDHRDQAERHFDAAKVALEYFDRWVGEYPYTTLTLVDGIGGSNGMEYPTLITCGTFYGIPSWVRVPLELVIIHEFGHQYFYGILASNEAEEAWLDEGMNSYLESRIMDDAYGPGSVLDLPGVRLGNKAMQSLAYTRSTPSRGAIFTRSWEYPYGDYGKASYSKPATVMNTLEGFLGSETMETFLRTYYSRWKFRHPTTEDLIETVEDVAEQDLDWFFDQFVYGTAVVDYGVSRLRSSRISDDDTTETDTPSRYRSEVWVTRHEDGVMPQTLRVYFDDGTYEDVAWDGEEEWREFSFERTARMTEARLDPNDVVWLDIDKLNNRRSLSGDDPQPRKTQLKVASLLQQLFYVIAGLL